MLHRSPTHLHFLTPDEECTFDYLTGCNYLISLEKFTLREVTEECKQLCVERELIDNVLSIPLIIKRILNSEGKFIHFKGQLFYWSWGEQGPGFVTVIFIIMIIILNNKNNSFCCEYVG